MSIKKHLNFYELIYKKKNPIDFLIDEIDVDPYFFHKFWAVYIVQNRVIWLCNYLSTETFSIKEPNFGPSNEYQIFKLTAELHRTRKEILLILENSKKHLPQNVQ